MRTRIAAVSIGVLIAFGGAAAAQVGHSEYPGACAPVGVCGDTDGSGDVSITDALRALRTAVGLPETLICEYAGMARPLRTGQTGCYSSTGDLVWCGSTVNNGQDGHLLNGISRSYTDNGDGTITDFATGLVWEKLSSDDGLHSRDAVYSWFDAFNNKIVKLNFRKFAGHSDWRVPNRFELETLLDLGEPNWTIAPIFWGDCGFVGCPVEDCGSCMPPFLNGGLDFWTSTTSQADYASAWAVNFYNGRVTPMGKPSSMRVRAVRSGS